MAIAWTCEDEEEAIGLALVMERAGVSVRIVEQGSVFVIEPADHADRAERLGFGIARHFVRVDERERAAQLDIRERWRARAWWGSIALGLLALTLAAWR